MAMIKPWPSLPSRFSFGTLQSSNINSHVADARIPILSSFLPMVKPSIPSSTMNADAPLPPLDGSVIAIIVYTLATPPFVIKCLVPLRIYESPSFFAVVFVASASEPASGSVKPNAARLSPRAIGGRYFFFCSSLPAMTMGNDPSAVPASASEIPPQARESSSVTNTKSITPPPIPSYSSSSQTLKKSISASIFTISHGNSPV